ncbi:filamentous hemagglutinin N-terminal domain-containing protein [Pandoraea sputorum]|uniref:tRNA nuclease CdiA-2 n=1 Tax=Pandoraea sputorum TaxID=93222 RepID=A0A5E5BD39_9BURK|nr:filamentous hemagglutinin N-terminal domain-containing protein [Pandoraea sputorum]VVE83226.1 tRNA nuclease CdiA-2 [Pandoraea sputorum]
MPWQSTREVSPLAGGIGGHSKRSNRSSGIRRFQQFQRVSRYGLATWLAAVAHCYAAGIVPDGGTATSVTVGANGRQNVNIAAPVYGVSHNTYTSFNVDRAGATLNNTGVNARTIVNEVTGTAPSLIQGQIAVAGPRANVILANPNGITVNGGSFVNTGHVALSTGQVSFNDVLVAPGLYQRNVVLNTGQGTIEVTGGGLAGTLIGLELIAKTVKVSAPITNDFSSPTAYVRVIAGSSKVSLNTRFSPDDNNNDWVTFANNQQSNPHAIALDIEPTGSITSGRIQLLTTDLGAGVRHAGAMMANAGDFSLTSAGDVLLAPSSKINVANNLSWQASGQTAMRGASILTGGSINLSSGSVLVANAGAIQSTLVSSRSGIVVNAQGDITNISSLIQGVTRERALTSSEGAITFNAGGTITNTSDQANPGGAFGVVFGVNDDVVMRAARDIVNLNARVESNQSVTMVAQGDLSNVISHTEGANGGVATAYANSGRRWLLFSTRDEGFSVDYGSLPAPGQLSYIIADAGNVTLSGRNVYNTGGTVLTNGGDIRVTATNTLVNQAIMTGQASYQRSCFIFCRAEASSTTASFGGQMQASGNISLAAGQSAANIGGNVIAWSGNLTVDAPLVTAQGLLGYTAYNGTRGLKAWFGNRWAAIYAQNDGGLFSAASGEVVLTGRGVIKGGVIAGAKGVRAAQGIETAFVPYRDPVRIGTHLGLTTWFGL